MARLLALLTLLGVLPAAAGAEDLARGASYTVVVSGFAYRGQVLPGSNTPATTEGYLDAPPWQGPAGTLTDGRRETAVLSWFWSQMQKRITATFDLRRPARIAAIRAYPPASIADLGTATARVAGTLEGLGNAPDLPMAPEGEGAAWHGGPLDGRFVRVVCASGAPQMGLAEVRIEGEPAGSVDPAAAPPGLRATPPRDLAALVKLPGHAAGVDNVARLPGVAVRPASGHHDDKTGAWVEEDGVAARSDPGGRALVDGDAGTAARSFAGWFSAKRITAEVDLGRPWQVERVVVWSAWHGGQERSYLNAFTTWLRAAPGAAWWPAGEARNPVLPGETPAAHYPVMSGEMGRPARFVRVQIDGAAQGGDVMQVGEIEVWGRALEGEVATKPLRVKRAVPAVVPVRLAKLSPALDWIRKERIRALYGYVGQWKDRALLGKAVSAGFNTLVVHTMGATHREAEWPREAAEWARVQRERKLRVVISWPFGSDERYGNTQFGAYQPGGSTHWERTPCPLSREYWDRVVGDRARIAARAGLAGLVVDMEMYGADSTRYSGPCYCDACFTRFVQEHLEGVDAGEIALRDRPAWMAGNGLARDYSRRQELQVTALLRRIERSVHAIRPRFLLGNLLDPESLPGLARGLGTPAMPALIFSELEYGGSLAGTPARIEHLQKAGYPALYVVGLALQPLTPPRLPALVAEAGVQSAGYWYWSTAAFGPKAGPDYAHAKGYSDDDYWRAFGAANTALSAALKTGGNGRQVELRR